MGLLGQAASSDTTVFCLLLKKLQDYCGLFLTVDDAILDLEFQRHCNQIAGYLPLITADAQDNRRFSDEVRQYWEVNTVDDYQLVSTLVEKMFWWEDGHNALYEFTFPQLEEKQPEVTETGAIIVPVPSSDLFEVDTLASLASADGIGLQDAMYLCDRASAEWIKTFVAQLHEVRRDPDERLEDYKRKCLQKTMDTWQAEDPGKYAQLLGLEVDED